MVPGIRVTQDERQIVFPAHILMSNRWATSTEGPRAMGLSRDLMCSGLGPATHLRTVRQSPESWTLCTPSALFSSRGAVPSRPGVLTGKERRADPCLLLASKNYEHGRQRARQRHGDAIVCAGPHDARHGGPDPEVLATEPVRQRARPRLFTEGSARKAKRSTV